MPGRVTGRRGGVVALGTAAVLGFGTAYAIGVASRDAGGNAPPARPAGATLHVGRDGGAAAPRTLRHAAALPALRPPLVSSAELEASAVPRSAGAAGAAGAAAPVVAPATTGTTRTSSSTNTGATGGTTAPATQPSATTPTTSPPPAQPAPTTQQRHPATTPARAPQPPVPEGPAQDTVTFFDDGG